MNEQIHTARCQDHFEPLPCARCEENNQRGYAVMMLAGRCANGSELDHGTRWHAVKPGEYRAVCGAKPGRRSAGWSSYTTLGQIATCPRCIKKLTIDVDGLIARRNKLTDRRDGLTDSNVINRIDAKLREIPTGQREDVDLLLGRVLPSYAVHDPESPREVLARQQRAEMDDETILTNWPLSSAACQIRRERSQAVTRWSSDSERAETKERGEAEAARLAAEMTDNYLMTIADQYDDMMDWHRIIGDLAL